MEIKELFFSHLFVVKCSMLSVNINKWKFNCLCFLMNKNLKKLKNFAFATIVDTFVQLGFSSNMEWTAGQSSGSNFSVLSFRPADQKLSSPK
jgi:hypothetical protein